MKSSEQTADEITDSIFRLIEQGDHDRESRFRMVSAVVQSALSGVRRETLEEAAKVAETPVEDDDRIDRQVRWDVATQIRSLSEDKEGG
jgi:hypothetical protein